MTAIAVVTVIILTIAFYVFVSPFYIELDSRVNKCVVRFNVLARARLYAGKESLFMDLQIIGWHKKIDLLTRQVKRSEKKARARGRTSGASLQKIGAVLKSFRLSNCHISVDTGDNALDGTLYPWLLLVSRLIGQDIRINFQNECKIVAVIENNFYRILKAYITH
jgi:hypothetical protein